MSSIFKPDDEKLKCEKQYDIFEKLKKLRDTRSAFMFCLLLQAIAVTVFYFLHRLKAATAGKKKRAKSS